MGIFDSITDQYSDQHAQVTGKHSASVTHELLAGAASYEAAKAWEKHCEKNGKPDSHAKAKELVAGFAGAFIDHIAETKGLDAIAKTQAKHRAKKELESALESDYGINPC